MMYRSLQYPDTIKIIEFLLQHGADVNLSTYHGETALMKSVDRDYGYNFDMCLLLLLYYGADVNVGDASGWTALMYASWYGNVRAVPLLLQVGADVHKVTMDGKIALSICEQASYQSGRLGWGQDDKEVIRLLKDAMRK